MENTGNKFQDLFNLSSTLSSFKKKDDIKTIDYEYQKGKNECTFKPDRSATKNKYNSNRSSFANS